MLGSSLEFVDAVSIQTSSEEVMLSSDNKVGNTQRVLSVLSVQGVLTFNTKRQTAWKLKHTKAGRKEKC